MIGLLWYDWDKKQSTEKLIADASKRYEERFGVKPTIVHVNENDKLESYDGVQIIRRKDVRPHQVWVTDGRA